MSEFLEVYPMCATTNCPGRGSTSSYWRAGLVCDDCAAYEHYVEEEQQRQQQDDEDDDRRWQEYAEQNFDHKRGDWKW